MSHNKLSEIPVYIISYLPNEEGLREKRHENLIKQIQFYGEKRITLLAMNYKDSDFIGGIDYIVHDKVSPGAARNLLLRKFYNSDYDYSIFCDDDCIYHSGGKYNKTLECLECLYFMDQYDIGVLYPVNGAFTPYNKEISKVAKGGIVEIVSRTAMSGGLFVMTNICKKFGKEVYFSDQFFGVDDLICGEDVDFGRRIHNEKLNVMQAKSWVLKEYCRKGSTWAKGDIRRDNSHRDRIMVSIDKRPPCRYYIGENTLKDFL